MKKLFVVIWAIALLVGCSGPSKPVVTEKPKPKEPELLTGRFAFQKLYIAAHGWARDAQPFRLESVATSVSSGKDGKAALWRASFASPLQHGVKPYIWSGYDFPDTPRGVNPGAEDNYSPGNSSTQVFDLAFLKIDSEKALETAQKHGGDKILEKTPDTPVVYQLDWSRSTNQLVWHVIYGGTTDSKLRVSVDASSGSFIRIEK